MDQECRLSKSVNELNLQNLSFVFESFGKDMRHYIKLWKLDNQAYFLDSKVLGAPFDKNTISTAWIEFMYSKIMKCI